MASFPNAIKQFITKIAHTDKVQSADINALQEEVEAIETTLLSGTEGQVLTSGSSSITWETVTNGSGGAVEGKNILSHVDVATGCAVSGAGRAAVNGYYALYGEENGKPFYANYNYTYYIVFPTDHWIIVNNSFVTIYEDAIIENVATPDLVIQWLAVLPDDEPTPTIALVLEEQNAPANMLIKSNGDGTSKWGAGSIPLYDNVTFAVGELDEVLGGYPVTFVLTLDGNPIEEETWVYAITRQMNENYSRPILAGNTFRNVVNGELIDNITGYYIFYNPNSESNYVVIKYIPSGGGAGNHMDCFMYIFLPSGKLAKSQVIDRNPW